MIMQISSWDSTGNVIVIAGNNKKYRYSNVSPHDREKCDNLIRKGYKGKAWKILSHYDVESIT